MSLESQPALANANVADAVGLKVAGRRRGSEATLPFGLGRGPGCGPTIFLSRRAKPISDLRMAVLPSSHTMSQQEIIYAYRHLLRQGLRAIQFSKPARFTLRDRIRLAFRKGSASDFDAKRIKNTLEFLQNATKENGLEHKIVKNLMFVWWGQKAGGKSKPNQKALSVVCSFT